jgi:hypothetical protein
MAACRQLSRDATHRPPDFDNFDIPSDNFDTPVDNAYFQNESSYMNVESSFPIEYESQGTHYWYDDPDFEFKESSSESESEKIDDSIIANFLSAWASKFHIPHTAIDELLKIWQKAGHKLPSTARSLLKTIKEVPITEKSGMQYFYMDISKQLKKCVKAFPEWQRRNINDLEISLNIDGLPLFKSSSTCVWPILCAIVSVKPARVFPVALCCGQTKPKNLDFLCDTVQDLKSIMNQGLVVGEQILKVRVRCIVCDSPARAMVLSVKQYSGYEGCDKCTQRGKWLGRMTYPEILNVELRTDESFREQSQRARHHGVSPLCELSIDMVKQVPNDYMHSTCLGTMRRLLLTWLRGKAQVRISASQANQISMRLLQLRKFVPKVFARKPRGLLEVDRWKATEFRLFLLYIGKLVLKGILSEELYDHFMALSVAISILVSPSLTASHHGYAHGLLVYFVSRCKELYGEEFLVYNIHSMLHVSADAREFGCLDRCSGFVFENYLQQIKKMVRSGNNPLAQIVKRLSESVCTNSTEHPVDPVILTKAPNNAYILKNSVCCEVVKVMDSANDGLILVNGTSRNEAAFQCRVYEKGQPLFCNPCDSRILGVFLVKTHDYTIAELQYSELKTRAIMVKQQDSLVFMSVLHETD